jgi:hypothetical protein
LGLIPGPDFDTHATAALTGSDPATAARLLENLVDQNLVIHYLPGRYRLHDLIRLHARDLAVRGPLRVVGLNQRRLSRGFTARSLRPSHPR